jgi:hypothetical protein
MAEATRTGTSNNAQTRTGAVQTETPIILIMIMIIETEVMTSTMTIIAPMIISVIADITTPVQACRDIVRMDLADQIVMMITMEEQAKEIIMATAAADIQDFPTTACMKMNTMEEEAHPITTVPTHLQTGMMMKTIREATEISLAGTDPLSVTEMITKAELMTAHTAETIMASETMMTEIFSNEWATGSKEASTTCVSE